MVGGRPGGKRSLSGDGVSRCGSHSSLTQLPTLAIARLATVVLGLDVEAVLDIDGPGEQHVITVMPAVGALGAIS